jgi:pilus assembly protein Flp/PilA
MLGKISEFATGLVARLRSKEGQALAEYALILALIGAVSILALTAAGLAISGTVDRLTQCLI